MFKKPDSDYAPLLTSLRNRLAAELEVDEDDDFLLWRSDADDTLEPGDAFAAVAADRTGAERGHVHGRSARGEEATTILLHEEVGYREPD